MSQWKVISMKPNLLLKLAALASSVLLVAALVCYLSGCASLRPTSARLSTKRSDSPNKHSEGQNVPPESGASQQNPSQTTEPARVIMSGSKSFNPAGFVQGLTPADPPSPANEPAKPGQDR